MMLPDDARMDFAHDRVFVPKVQSASRAPAGAEAT